MFDQKVRLYSLAKMVSFFQNFLSQKTSLVGYLLLEKGGN